MPMNFHTKALLACGAIFTLPAYGAQDGCPKGSYTVVVSPDHATLSILFDKFQIENSAAAANAPSMTCQISHALNLPPNTSLGVYKVDYRGFAKLNRRDEASLEVRYALSPRGNEHGRAFRRKIKGAYDGDYFFTETIGAGQMKRAGCGAQANLNVSIALALAAAEAKSTSTSVPESNNAMVALDTSDGKSAAMVYHLDLKKCR